MRQIFGYYKATVGDAGASSMEPPTLKSLRAGDIESTCRYVLMQHPEPFKPLCLFGNILDRAPADARARLEQLRKQYRQEVGLDQKPDESPSSRPRKRKGAPSKDSKDEFISVGRQFIAEAVDLLRKRIPSRRSLRGHCYCHGQQCVAKFIRPLAFPDGLVVHVAGFSCTDWSSMGYSEGWLGKTSLIFAQWLAEQMETPEQDFLVTECTNNFDAEHFACLVSDRYELTVIHVSPELLGEPTRRNRMYMILLDKSRRQWRLQASAQEVYEKTFRRRPCMNVLEKVRAPDSLVREFIDKMVAKRKMPPTSASGRKWGYVQACSASVRSSIQEHTQKIRQMTATTADATDSSSSHMDPELPEFSESS